MLGMLGVGTGVLASLLAAGFSPEVLTQFGVLASAGALAGKFSPYRSSLRDTESQRSRSSSVQVSSLANALHPQIFPRLSQLCTPSSVSPLY